MGLKYFLQGKWLGHPLHPILAHIPMGLWPAALILDLASRTAGDNNILVQLSFFAIALGLLSAFAAIPAGLADWSGIKKEKPAWKLGLYHLILNGISVVVWLGNLAIRFPTFNEAPHVTGLQLTLSAVGTAILLVGGWFGGRMVFDQGTSIARQSKSRWRKIAEKGNSALPDK